MRQINVHAQGCASSAAYGNRFVSGFCQLSTSLASDPSSQMSSPGRIRGDGPVRGRRTQCPHEASRGAARSQVTTETIASSMAIRRRQEMLACRSAACHRALSPRQRRAETERVHPSSDPRKVKLPRCPETVLSGIVRLADGDERCDVARGRLSVGMWQGAITDPTIAGV